MSCSNVDVLQIISNSGTRAWLMRLSRIAPSKTVPTTFSCQRHLVIQVSVLFRKIMQRMIILGKHFEEWSAVRWRFIKLRQRSKNWAWLILHGLTCWSCEPCISVGHLTNRAIPLCEHPSERKFLLCFSFSRLKLIRMKFLLLFLRVTHYYERANTPFAMQSLGWSGVSYFFTSNIFLRK